jgi:hypothetical protein
VDVNPDVRPVGGAGGLSRALPLAPTEPFRHLGIFGGSALNFARAVSTSPRFKASTARSSPWPSWSHRRRLDAAERHADEPQPRCHRLFGTNSRRNPRSDGVSNATVRILSDDPAPFEGLGAALRERPAVGHPWSKVLVWVVRGRSSVERLTSNFTLSNDSRSPVARGCSALRRSAALCTRSRQNHSDFGRFLRLGPTLNLRVVGSIPTRLTNSHFIRVG